MKHVIEQSGNVTFIAEAGDVETLQDIKDRTYVGSDDNRFLGEMLEEFGYSTNGGFQQIYPEDVGALTDAPMFADEVIYSDSANQPRIAEGNVYWFPNYQVENFADTLIRDGKVTFRKAA